MIQVILRACEQHTLCKFQNEVVSGSTIESVKTSLTNVLDQTSPV